MHDEQLAQLCHPPATPSSPCRPTVVLLLRSLPLPPPAAPVAVAVAIAVATATAIAAAIAAATVTAAAAFIHTNLILIARPLVAPSADPTSFGTSEDVGDAADGGNGGENRGGSGHRGDGLGLAKSGSASTHQHAESTATSQTSNQPNKRDDNHLYRCHLGVEERSAPRFDS
uniref:Uncharacterized protein n=1 Tax=Florenciella parvula TaxID=236787 RepID=A0A7S2G4G0_9STRA